MCGRIVLSKSPAEVAAFFGLGDVPDLRPRFNIPPGGPIAAVLADGPDRVLRLLQWGISAPGPGRGGKAPQLINARGETIARKPAFAASFADRRCLIPVNGFYEWKPERGRKQAFLVRRRDGGLFALAGIWDTWEYPGGAVREACAIVTSAASGFMRPIHHRQPVIVAPADWPGWLGAAAASAAELRDMMAPRDSEDMIAHPVDPRVGNPDFDAPACLEPWRPGREGQLDLFASEEGKDHHD